MPCWKLPGRRPTGSLFVVLPVRGSTAGMPARQQLRRLGRFRRRPARFGPDRRPRRRHPCDSAKQRPSRRPGGCTPDGGFRDRPAFTWGPNGTTLHRNGTAAGAKKGHHRDFLRPRHWLAAHRRTWLRRQSPLPRGRRGGPCLRPAPERDRTPPGRSRTARHLVQGRGSRRLLAEDPLAELYEELLSPRGPFWTSADERAKRLPPEVRSSWPALSRIELDALKKKTPWKVERGGRRAGRRPQGHAP